MDSTTAALLGAIIGGSFSCLGIVLNTILQGRQQRWAAQNERTKDLFQKRLVALQNGVRLVDFLIAAKNVHLIEEGLQEWTRIRRENVCNGVLFPPELQKDFEAIIQKYLMLDSLHDSEEKLDFEGLKRFRDGCVDYIEKKFG